MEEIITFPLIGLFGGFVVSYVFFRLFLRSPIFKNTYGKRDRSISAWGMRRSLSGLAAFIVTAPILILVFFIQALDFGVLVYSFIGYFTGLAAGMLLAHHRNVERIRSVQK